uniref:Fe/B12 periplasmic-binding domain-containing protein n=1 Tax=candidate division WOR-3 bacterium TaxID=2052148 RepID=A0A7C4TBE6_UNCW3
MDGFWKNTIRYLTVILFFIFFCKGPPQNQGFRIVSLSPGMTEIIFALGAQKNLVGNTTYCDYPDSAKRIYKVGDFSNPSLERIVSLRPNLVILNLPEQGRIKRELDRLKIKTFVSSPGSLADLYAEIINIGKIINKGREADSIVKFMKENIKPLNRRQKSVYIELSPKPLITIGANSFLNELIEMAGGKNIFSDLNKDYPVVAQEEVIKRNPEIIIILHPGEIKGRLGWERISAVKNCRIYKNLNQDWLLRPGPRLVLGFNELKEILE